MSDGINFSIDMHVHSEGSFDGKEPVDLILEQAADIGLDAVVITDHDEIEESLEAAEKAEEYGLMGIPGVEVSTAAGHLLAIDVDERPEEKMTLEKTVKQIRDMGGAAVVPHPFQRSRHGIKKRNIDSPDAIEVYNAWSITGYRNRSARKFARERDIPGIAASDAHSIATIGRAYTEIEIEDAESKDEISTKDVIHKIRENEQSIHGKRVPIHRSITHYSKAFLRKTKHYTTWTLQDIPLKILQNIKLAIS